MQTHFKRYLNTFRSWITVAMCSTVVHSLKRMLASPRDRQVSKKMAEARLSSKSARPFWSGIWNAKNVVVVGQWRREYATEPPTRLTIARIRVKFETHCTVYDVHKGRSGKYEVLLLLLRCWESLHARYISLPKTVHVRQELAEQAYDAFLKQQDGKFSSEDYYMHWMKTTLIEGCSIECSKNTVREDEKFERKMVWSDAQFNTSPPRSVTPRLLTPAVQTGY